MVKCFDDPIAVYNPKVGSPFFIWKGRKYRVLSIINDWRESTKWWKANEQVSSDRFRVQAKSGASDPGTFELVYDNRKKEWRLTKVID